MLKELFDFSYIIPSEKSRHLLFLFMLTMLVYALNILPDDIPLAGVLLLCVVSPIELCFFQFTFYTLFEGFAIFSFGLTLNVVLQLILLFKVINFISKHPSILKQSIVKMKSWYSAYWLLYAGLALFVWGNLTGLAFFFRIVISLMVVWFVQVRNKPYNYWKAIFHIITLSVFCSIIFGMFHDTSLERDIEGSAGSVFQLYGSLGTTRLGMFLVVAMIYPLYFVRNITLKIGLISVFTVLTFMTVSLTAAIVLVILFGVYLISLNKFGKIVTYSIISIVFLVGTFSIWSKLPFVEPTVLRVEETLDLYYMGNLDKATSGREHIQEAYMFEYYKRSTFNKVVGVFNPENFDKLTAKFAHNSYIDMLAYNGILGIVLLVFYCFKSVLYYRKSDVFYPVLTMKLVLLVAAYTVSIFMDVYFTWYLFM